MSHPYEGSFIAEYYTYEPDHEVIFLGDCEFYESISPVRLFEEYGISSYVRGSAQQLIWQSYYVLLDTLKHEKPKVVVLNACEMKIGDVQNEAYTRMTLDGLKDINYRLKAANILKKSDETLISYVFPLLRYHSRWSDLTGDDFKYYITRDKITYAGYHMQTDIRPKTREDAPWPPLFDYSFPEICYEYLDKITALCKENDIKLILFKSPTASWQYPWYEEWNDALYAYAEKNDILYLNGLEHTAEMNLDMTCDSYDEGVHLNVYGAEKCSDYLGSVLSDGYSLSDLRNDNNASSAWKEVCERYHTAKGDK